MKKKKEAVSVANQVRHQIEMGGERMWRLTDFSDLPFTAIAQALSRLCRAGVIQRIGKGLYYRPRETIFGPSKPSINQLRAIEIQQKGVFPAGISAANLLGFSTQSSAREEVATNGLSLPRLIVGKETIIHTRRPEAWRELTAKEAAILEFLRDHGWTSELSPRTTVSQLLKLLQKRQNFRRLFQVAQSEPPRVRAMLGAIGQELGYPEGQLEILRDSLNPLSQFDFGNLSTLKYARQWQAKEHKPREAI